MRFGPLAFVIAAIALAACGPSSSTDAGTDASTPPADTSGMSCTGISGSYAISGMRASGSCPGSDPESLTVDITADTSMADSYSLAFTSGTGGASYTCVGRLVGCQLMTTCNAMLGSDMATLDATWNFTNAGFSGTHAYRVTLADSTMCTASFNLTATRQ